MERKSTSRKEGPSAARIAEAKKAPDEFGAAEPIRGTGRFLEDREKWASCGGAGGLGGGGMGGEGGVRRGG